MANKPRLDAVGCGSMAVDLFYRTPRIIRADEKVVLDTTVPGAGVERAEVGGVVLNHLGWARILGLEVGIVGRMGNDRHGDFLRQGMDRLGIRHHLTLGSAPSSFSTVFVDAAGNRAIYMMRGATAELRAGEIRRLHGSFLRRARFVTTEISQLPLKAVLALLKFARDHGIPSVVDLDVPPSDATAVLGTRSELERALRLATYLKPAKAAARELVGAETSDDMPAMAQAIRARYGNRAVAITQGEQGCTIAARNETLQVSGFKVRVVDATGAGDAFLGAMVAGLRWGLSWAEIGRLANAAGAVCVGRLGAFPTGFELREEISRLYGGRLAGRRRPRPRRAAKTPAPRRSLDPDQEVARFFTSTLGELAALRRKLDVSDLLRAVSMIRRAEVQGGRVHITGVGKPEHVARYAASLLCSVGTMATFLHATESLHGSLRQVGANDVVIAISNSGNTTEMCATAAAIKEHGAQLVAVTGDNSSELAVLADLVIHAPVKEDGGILGLAPRISVMAEVCVLAALSVALEVTRGLTFEEYSRWHRAGTLGEAARRLAENAPVAVPDLRLVRSPAVSRPNR